MEDAFTKAAKQLCPDSRDLQRTLRKYHRLPQEMRAGFCYLFTDRDLFDAYVAAARTEDQSKTFAVVLEAVEAAKKGTCATIQSRAGAL